MSWVLFFFFNKCSSDCYKPLVNFQNSEKLDSDDFCQVIAFMEDGIFRDLCSAIFADFSTHTPPHSLKVLTPGSQPLSPALFLGLILDELLTVVPMPLLLSSLATSLAVILSSIFSQLLLLYQCPWAKLSIFVNKVYLNTALLLHSCIVYSFFQTTTAELAVTVETIGPEGLKYLFSLKKKLTDSCLKISRLELYFFHYLNFKNPVLQPSSPLFLAAPFL